VDLEQMSLYDPEILNESVSLPGQLQFLLKEKRQGLETSWYLFRLRDGANENVTAVRGPEGPITTFDQRPADADLRVIVEVPKQQLARRRFLEIHLASGATYRFKLNASSLARSIRDIVDVTKKK
jgi:hypothetical protein